MKTILKWLKNSSDRYWNWKKKLNKRTQEPNTYLRNRCWPTGHARISFSISLHNRHYFFACFRPAKASAYTHDRWRRVSRAPLDCFSLEKHEKITTVLQAVNQRDDLHDHLFFLIHLFTCLLVWVLTCLSTRFCLFQSLYLSQILTKLSEIIYSYIHSTFNLCVDPLFTHRYFVTNYHYTRKSLYRNRAQRFLSLREPVERGDWIWSRKLFLYSGRSGGAFLPPVNKVQHFKKVL